MIDFENNPLFVDAPVAYSVLDASGLQIAANRKFWELFGYPADSLLSVVEITHADSQDQTVDYLGELVHGKRDSVVAEKRYVRADGSEFWGRLTATRLDTESGEPLLLGVIEDVEEQKALERRLRAAANEKSEFVARVSHEIRNPLHTIAGLAELLTTSDIDGQAQRQAGIVLREARGLTSIVSDLLDIGKFDTGNLAIEKGPFAVRSLIDRSVRSGQTAAAAKDLRFQASIDDAIPIYAIGDKGRVGQVIDNLCGNAIKFTSLGLVTLEVTKGVGDTIEFVVTDTGPGIPEERQADIFEPFQRLNASAPGAGLGLAISSRLATSMGGELRLRGSSPEGSIFVLSLPLPETTEAPESAGISQPGTGQKTSRVLVVEDNPETQMLASAQLTRLGYEHDVVGDGYEALAISDKGEYGAILMDWHLPGIDGLETTRRMRQREEREGRKRTPIISVTARAMAADIEACRQAGADDFVAKPASIGRISEVLDQWAGGTTIDGSLDASDIDTDVFTTLIDELGDPELVASLASTFLAELPRRVEVIVDSGTDTEAAQLAAHTLKSTSAMVGATALHEVSAAIEKAAREGEIVSEQNMEQLHAAASSTDQSVRQLIDRLEQTS